MVSVYWFVGLCESQGRKPKARGPSPGGAEAVAAPLARLGPPAAVGEERPLAAGAVLPACTARPARRDAWRGYVTPFRGPGRARAGEGVVTALLLVPASAPVLSQFLPLQALVIITALPSLLRCVHPWKHFRVKGLTPSPGTTGGCGPFQR